MVTKKAKHCLALVGVIEYYEIEVYEYVNEPLSKLLVNFNAIEYGIDSSDPVTFDPTSSNSLTLNAKSVSPLAPTKLYSSDSCTNLVVMSAMIVIVPWRVVLLPGLLNT